MFLNSFNYFRGVAIVFIVTGHCLGMSEWYPGSVPEKLIYNLISGGTAFFVFISGFLFHHIFYDGFIYRNFISKKIKNVLSPYLVMSAITICYFVLVARTGPYQEYFFSTGTGILVEYVRPAGLYLLTGAILPPYWYIPFIMVIFALSPLFVRYIKLTSRSRIIIMLLFFTVSIFIHRPIYNISILQSVVYFVPVYLFGIIASIHKEQIYNYLAGKEVYLISIVFALALFQVLLYKDFANLHKNPFEITVPDINIIQKCFLCLFFMVWLHRFEAGQFAVLNNLAKASFAIYFLHPIILSLSSQRILSYIHLYSPNFVGLGTAFRLIYIPAVLLSSLAAAIIIRNIFQSRSRLIVGW